MSPKRKRRKCRCAARFSYRITDWKHQHYCGNPSVARPVSFQSAAMASPTQEPFSLPQWRGHQRAGLAQSPSGIGARRFPLSAGLNPLTHRQLTLSRHLVTTQSSAPYLQDYCLAQELRLSGCSMFTGSTLQGTFRLHPSTDRTGCNILGGASRQRNEKTRF